MKKALKKESIINLLLYKNQTNLRNNFTRRKLMLNFKFINEHFTFNFLKKNKSI